MTKLKFTSLDYNKFIQTIDSLDFNNNDYTIETDYLEAKAIAKQAKKQPTVLSGAMHKDVWYLPNGSSSEAQFLKDANVNYLWSDTTGNGSLALSFEVVLEKAKDAFADQPAEANLLPIWAINNLTLENHPIFKSLNQKTI